MDQETLVSEQIEDGKRLLERLVEEGVAVTAACWIKESENGRWYLYIASDLVSEDGGSRKAYRRINETVRRMPQPFWIGRFKVKAVAPSDPVAEAAREIYRRYPSKDPTHWGGGKLGRVDAEEVYIYPPFPAPTPEDAVRP